MHVVSNPRLNSREFPEGPLVEEEWENLKGALHGSAEENVGFSKRKKIRKPWITEEMIDKMDQRRTLKNDNSAEGKRGFKRLNNELRRATDTARTKLWEQQCKELEDLNRSALGNGRLCHGG